MVVGIVAGCSLADGSRGHHNRPFPAVSVAEHPEPTGEKLGCQELRVECYADDLDRFLDRVIPLLGLSAGSPQNLISGSSWRFLRAFLGGFLTAGAEVRGVTAGGIRRDPRAVSASAHFFPFPLFPFPVRPAPRAFSLPVCQAGPGSTSTPEVSGNG